MASPIPTQLSPGVNISEIDLSQFVQPESLNSAGMVGTFNWGPALVANRVTTESNLAEVYGKPTLDQSDTLSEEDFFSAANFLKYSNNLKVVRILQEEDYNATSTEPNIDAIDDVDNLSISNIEEFANLGGFSGQNGIESNAVFRARYPGNFGNSLRVVLFDGGSGSSEETQIGTVSGLIDYEIPGPNFIGITSGIIGFTMQAISASTSLNPPFLTLGTTFCTVPYYLVSMQIPGGIGSLTTADEFSFAYATGTTAENYSLMNNGDEPSGNRENYFRPFNTEFKEHFNVLKDDDFKRFFTYSTGFDDMVQMLFLDGDETNMAGSFRVGLTLDGSADPTRLITNYFITGISGYPVTFNYVIQSGDASGNLDWYRFNYSRYTVNKIFPGGVAPNTGVRGLAKFIAMTGGVSYANFVNGEESTPVGVTFNTIGGITGLRNDFIYGLKQFVYNGQYSVITNSSSPNGTQISSPIFDKPPQTSAYARNLGGSNDELSFAVIDTEGKFGAKGAVLERFELLSKAVDAKNLDGESIYYKDFINYNSRYVYMTKPLEYTGGGSPSSDATTTFGDIVQNYVDIDDAPKVRTGIYESDLAYGQSGVTGVSVAEYADAYKLFADDDYAVDVLFVPESSVASTSAPVTTEVEELVYNTVIAPRKDTILILPTPKPSSVLQHTGEVTTGTINFRNRLTIPSNSYTMLVAGRKTYFDTFNNQIRKMSLSSDVAGILCAQEIPWESPAGFSRGFIRNAIKLETNFTKADRDELYKNGINFFVQFNDGSGTVLFGDKTLLKKPSAFDRINVRRVFIALEKAIGKAAKYSLFEFNDEFTRSQFRNLVVPFLTAVQAQRGIVDFKVVCDETNNIQEVINKNQFVADIYIKPAKSVNFIQLNFIAVKSDFNLATLE